MLIQMVHLSDLSTFSGAFQWVIAHGYILIFIAMLIEGPIVTVAAAFASALGLLNIYLVFVLSFFGDLAADVIYYSIGYFSRLAVIERFGKHFGLSEKRMHRIESLLNGHAVKTLIALKLMPALPTPGLMIVGAVHMPIKKFTKICALIIFPRTIILVIMGYYFGAAYDMISRQLQERTFTFLIVIGVVFLIYYGFTKLLGYFSKKVEKI
jgi:membrane protein DedA with SNARE-associated domain